MPKPLLYVKDTGSLENHDHLAALYHHHQCVVKNAFREIKIRRVLSLRHEQKMNQAGAKQTQKKLLTAILKVQLGNLKIG